jgi:endonuclease/exonuclease/phosphatase family metal-dependent hydrolase
MANLPSNLPTILRNAGLKVVEVAGWKTRGRPGPFAPVGVLCHHTATKKSSSDSNVVNLLKNGRSDLPGPLAQFGLARDGTVYIIAAGRSNHAGKAKASGTVAAGDGNTLYIGIEAFNDGVGEPWPAAQRNAYVRLAAVLSVKITGSSSQTVRGHKETSVTGKIDPRGIDMGKFRSDVSAEMKRLTSPPPAPKPDPEPVTSHTRWAVRVTGVHETKGGKKLRDLQPGESFQVIDGSGHGNDGWIETTHHNWVVGADTTTVDPAAPATLKVMTWNVKTNRSWTNAVLPELKGVLATHKPDVVCLQECYDAPDLNGKVPGYAFRYQGYGYPPKTPGYIEERSEQIILVRDGVTVKVSAALEMLVSWKGPNVGAWHDPRVHRRVTVAKDGINWRVVDFHGPFGAAAENESNAAMVDVLKTFPADEPVIIVGDWNQSNGEVVTRVGAPGGAVVDGGGIDLAVFRDCRKVAGQNLGNFGSDHPVKIWTFEI